MKRCIIFALGLVFFVEGALAGNGCDSGYSLLSPEALTELLKPLEKKSVVRSQYQQTRVMRVLKKPLLAEGRMIFSPDEGLLWQVEKPLSYQLVMTPSFFLQKNADKEQFITANEQPALFAISTVFADLLGGKLASAGQYFSIAGQSNMQDRWQLCLQPLTEPFSRLMSHILIEGGRTVHQVHFRDVGGDYTDIVFQSYSTAPLTDAEKIFFVRP